MGARSALRGVQCALAGLLLVGGVMAFESLASPVFTGPKGWSEGVYSDDNLLPADRWWSLLPGLTPGDFRVDLAARGRWPGANDLPYCPEAYADLPEQFDNSVRQGSGLYEDLLRKRGAYSQPAGTSELRLGGMIDSVLRNAWDSIADESNTANISLAGIEMSVTLRGDQRSLMINGYDVLSTLGSGGQSQEMLLGEERAAAEGTRVAGTTPPRVTLASHESGNLVADVLAVLEELRGFVFHPLTIFFALTFFAAWLSVRVMHAVHERRRSLRTHRHRR